MGEKPSSEWFTTALIVAILLSSYDYFYVVPITHISKCIVSLLSNCAYFYAASKYTYTYLYLIYIQIYLFILHRPQFRLSHRERFYTMEAIRKIASQKVIDSVRE